MTERMSLLGAGEKGAQIIRGYKGPFSTYEECHSFVIGFYHSMIPHSQGIPEKLMEPASNKYNRDVDLEPHMAKYGYICGEYTRYAAIGLLLLLGQ